MRTLLILLLAGGAVLPAALPAQSAPFELSVSSIMRGPELVGRTPGDVAWTPDGRWIYFRWNEPGTDWREPLHPFRVQARAGARPERVTPAHFDSVAPLLAATRETGSGRLRAVTHQGDLYLVDVRAASARRLTRTVENVTQPRLSADARSVFFVRGDNAFAIEVATGQLRQLTDIRPDTAAAPRPSEQRQALEREERALLEPVRDRLWRDSLRDAERDRRAEGFPRPLHLRRDERVATLAVSPSGHAALLVTETRGQRARQTEVPRFVTASGYTESARVRGKVGDEQPYRRVGLMRLPEGEITWLQLTPGDTTRTRGIGVVGWNETGSAALVSVRAADNKSRTLLTVWENGALVPVDLQSDPAWVAHKSYENTAALGQAGWLDGGRRVWFVSEADGFAHLYTVAADGTDRRQLTRGRWEVQEVALSHDGRHFLLHTSELAFQRHLFRMPVGGGARERITTQAGGHTGTASPDGRQLALVSSQPNRPPELFIAPLRPGAAMAQLTVSPTAQWLSHGWIHPEIVRVPASDGVEVPARIYRPEEAGAVPNGAAVIFVHGAGYLHNVHDYWSTYYREYMFHHLLASRGFVVLDLDFRGSAGHGRDWRTAIYRHMGGRDLQDQVDASRWLGREFGIHPERVGIYGGSYGGFITLMALFTEPDHFGAGAALRAVTDWAHYNHGYSGNILNLPHQDTVAYRRSSPIYHAEGLRDPLLIAHGMEDVNVHFQDVVRLAQRLIDLGKTDWEMAVYPVEDHAFERPSSWADQYRRILELFERSLGPERAHGASVE